MIDAVKLLTGKGNLGDVGIVFDILDNFALTHREAAAELSRIIGQTVTEDAVRVARHQRPTGSPKGG